MYMNQEELIRLLYMQLLKMQHTLIVLELHIFQRKLENSLKIKIFHQIFLKYKHVIQ